MRRLAVVAALCVATPAVAAPRFTRAPTTATVPDRPERKRAEPSSVPVGPTFTGDDALAIAGLVAGLNADKVTLFEQLIADTPDDEIDEKASLWFQLAEVHAEQHRYWRLEAAEASIAGKSDAAAAKHARAELVAAVTSYQEITDDERYASFKQMDRVLFLLGFMAEAGRYEDESRGAYRRLIKEYPASPYVASAHFAFGDRDFELADRDRDDAQEHLLDALVEYKAVLALPASSVTPYARYKVGWVALALARPEDALAAFYQVVDDSRGVAELAPLHRAAAKDLVRAYAEVGKADKAHKYFQKVDKQLAFEMLERLADLWAEQGKSAKAIDVYRELVGLDGKHAHVCSWQYAVARLTTGKAAQVDEIETLVALSGKLAARKGKGKLPADELAACRDDAAMIADDLARAYHAEWMKTRDDDTLGLAERLYRVFLDGFPGADDHGEMAYYHANLAWARAEAEGSARRQTERWEETAAAFPAVVHGRELAGALLVDAAEAAVQAWINADAADPRAKVTAPAEGEAITAPAPTPLPAREQQLLAAIADYRGLEAKTDDDMLVEMTFVEAKVYRRYDHLEEALVPLADLALHHRAHERGPIAIDLLLHALNRLGREDELIRWVGVLLDDGKLLEREPELATRLRHLDHQARRKQAEACDAAAKKSGDDRRYVACGQGYVDLWNADPDVADADQLLWNAAIDLERGRSIGTAIEIFEALAREYPKSELAARALVKLGDNYARIAWYREAAEKLEEYAKRYGGEHDAFDAMNDAVLYRKGIGDDKQAIADTSFFVDAFEARDGAAAADASYSLTAIYEKKGDPDATVKHLRRYVARFGAKGGVAREVGAWSRIAELLWARSCGVTTVDGSCVKVARERAVRRTGGRARTKLPTQCGDSDKIRLVVVARDAALLKQARAAMAMAVAAYERGGRPRAARSPYARARFLQAEASYEAYLALAFPANLDFTAGKAKKSLARFDAWVKARRTAGAKAAKLYGVVVEIKEPDDAIASAARLGQIEQNFAAALYTAPIPASVRTGAGAAEAVDTYCTTLDDVAAPHEEEAVHSFDRCLAASTRLGWFSTWSRLCERELGQLRPDAYPTAAELRAAPDTAAALTALEPAARLR
jgi:outer membrane protein assembly factor BamD (BamD/ComL family)